MGMASSAGSDSGRRLFADTEPSRPSPRPAFPGAELVGELEQRWELRGSRPAAASTGARGSSGASAPRGSRKSGRTLPAALPRPPGLKGDASDPGFYHLVPRAGGFCK